MRPEGRCLFAVALVTLLIATSDAVPVPEEASELGDQRALPSVPRQTSPLMAAMAPPLPDTPGDAGDVSRDKRTLFKKRPFSSGSCGGGCCGGCSVCGGCGGGGGGHSYSSSGSYSYSRSYGYGRR
ncbi:uncharacterized protein LOC124617922 [Schistocerca americana]|uniref:uncharacterized protein LOC124617922 n=1 Tax=Schistocerca americana TaxID=7009 RepID=UPI001F500E14|nr:uncharacterized protein LOC124617922 [Schistocerca americana]